MEGRTFSALVAEALAAHMPYDLEILDQPDGLGGIGDMAEALVQRLFEGRYVVSATHDGHSRIVSGAFDLEPGDTVEMVAEDSSPPSPERGEEEAEKIAAVPGSSE